MISTKKIEHSIELLKKTEKLALLMNEEGYYLAFSGGKDSQCIYHLAQMAGVKFKAYYSVTTLDPPELIYFIRKNYPDVTFIHPKKNFFNICKQYKSLPSMIVRFCCKELKEINGSGTVTIIGIRHSESSKRANRQEFEKLASKKSNKRDVDFDKMESLNFQCVKGKDKFSLSPIIDWTDDDVWSFLNDVAKVEHCCLYDQGAKRIGCLFCPMKNGKLQQQDADNYPKYFQRMMDTIHYLRSHNLAYTKGLFVSMTDEDVWEWYKSKQSIATWYGLNKSQQKLF
jgi:phosphoadenosine phosphosulfate reductase